MQGLCKQIFCLAELHHSSKVHNTDLIGNMFHNRQVMADKQIGQIQILLQITQQVDNLRLNGYVKSGYSFVTDDHLRLNDQSSCDTDTLSLTAGERMGIAHQVRGIQTDFFCHFLGLLIHFSLGHLGIVGLQRLLDDVKDGHTGIQRRVGILKDHLDLLANFLHLLFVHFQEVDFLPCPRAVKHLTFGCIVRTNNASAEGGLTTAGLTNDTDGFTGLHIKADIRHRSDGNTLGCKTLMQILYF